MLKKYSIISGDAGRINVHRLVQNVIRLKVKSEKREPDIIGMMLENIYFDHFYGKSHFISPWRVAENYDQLVEQYAHLPSEIYMVKTI